MKQRILVILAFVLLVFPHAALAHEFWIEARKHQVDTGEKIQARLLNGQKFKGVELAWFPPRIVRSGWMNGPYGGAFDSRPGDRPAIHMQPKRPGLYRLIYEAAPQQLTYRDPALFPAFARKKGQSWAIARHAARGLPDTGFTESYRRFCKALIAVGDGAGEDSDTGMELELIARTNPYRVSLSDGVLIELRYRGAPLPDNRITVFEKSAAGEVQISHVQTDPQGQAVLELRAGRRYLVDAVVLREPESPQDTADPAAKTDAWESLWAALSFATPE